MKKQEGAGKFDHAKHLRKFGKRVVAKRVRRAGKKVCTTT